MSKPLISILMPTFNRASIIGETINSILEQTYSNWECIIVDDNSEDNTSEILQPYLKDKRIKLFIKPLGVQKGANASRNYAFNLASGEYIYWFDSDDIIHPKTFELCMIQFFSKKIDFCRFERTVFYNEFNNSLFDNYIINEESYFIDISKIEKIVINEIPFNTCCLIWKRKSLGIERFVDDLLYSEEWEFYSRLISNNLIGISINKTLIYARKHNESQTYEFNMKIDKRFNAKKKAAFLILINLHKKDLLSNYLKKYLINIILSFYDNILNKKMIDEISSNKFTKFLLKIYCKSYSTRMFIYKKTKK